MVSKDYYKNIYMEEKEAYDSLLESYNELLTESKKNDIITVINQIPDLLYTGGVSNSQIKEAEQELGLKFAADYKKYLQQFGAISGDGIELSGIIASRHCNVVVLTNRERELNKLIPENMYVIEDLGIEGVTIWQDKSGVIYTISPYKSPKRIYSSLSEYILSKYK